MIQALRCVARQVKAKSNAQYPLATLAPALNSSAQQSEAWAAQEPALSVSMKRLHSCSSRTPNHLKEAYRSGLDRITIANEQQAACHSSPAESQNHPLETPSGGLTGSHRDHTNPLSECYTGSDFHSLKGLVWSRSLDMPPYIQKSPASETSVPSERFAETFCRKQTAEASLLGD